MDTPSDYMNKNREFRRCGICAEEYWLDQADIIPHIEKTTKAVTDYVECPHCFALERA